MGPIVVRLELTPAALSLAGGKTEMNARFADRLSAFVAAHGGPFTLSQLPEGVTIEHSTIAGLTTTLLCETTGEAGRGATYLLLAVQPSLLREQLDLDPDDITLPELVRDLVCAWPEIACWESQDFSAAARLERLCLAAADLIARERRVSAAYLQRRLQVSYQTALKVLAKLETDGAISPADASGRRTVLVPPP